MSPKMSGSLQSAQPKWFGSCRATGVLAPRSILEGTAPIKTNTGKEILASGSLSDEQLGAMDYYVEGVIGKVPVGK